ncbi:hypothetical protein EAE96_005275 [Botrytis aclada]|nr:hypothetical protein EAE96_005275 [Botrytis aclada]
MAGTNGDKYELTDAEKSNIKANQQPIIDPLQLFASEAFDAGIKFAFSSLMVATFRRVRVPAERQEFLRRCLSSAAKIDPDLFQAIPMYSITCTTRDHFRYLLFFLLWRIYIGWTSEWINNQWHRMGAREEDKQRLIPHLYAVLATNLSNLHTT